MDSYDYRPIYLRNWRAYKRLESATMNIVQESARYMPSGCVNSSTGLSRVRGSIDLHSLLSRAGGTWPIDEQPLQWPPTLAPSWQPLSHPGRSTLQWKKMLLLSIAGLGLPDREFTWTPGESDTSFNFTEPLGSFLVKDSKLCRQFLEVRPLPFLFHKEKFQDVCTFQTRKGLTFSLLARCFHSRSLCFDVLSVPWVLLTNHA